MNRKKITHRLLDLAKSVQHRYYRSDFARLSTEAKQQSAFDLWQSREKIIAQFGKQPSFLIFKPDEIGDAVCALPAIAALRASFPDSVLTVVCQSKSVPIYERTELLDSVVAWNPRVIAGRFALGKPFSPLPSADISIFLRSYPMYFSAFRRLPGRLKVHPRDPRLSSSSPVQPYIDLWTEPRGHQTLQLLQIMSPLTGKKYSDADVFFPVFRWRPEDQKLPKLAAQSYLVIHPFADFETRRYPVSQWATLLKEIKRRFNYRLVFVGGPNDATVDFGIDLLQLQGKLSLAQTGFLISQAKAFIGNLSGPAHLSAALGTPTITLMSGHSMPSEWAPRGNSLVLRHDVPCAPCHLRECYQFKLRCLTELQPGLVLPAIENFLKHLI